jgi:hypothetical protein
VLGDVELERVDANAAVGAARVARARGRAPDAWREQGAEGDRPAVGFDDLDRMGEPSLEPAGERVEIAAGDRDAGEVLEAVADVAPELADVRPRRLFAELDEQPLAGIVQLVRDGDADLERGRVALPQCAPGDASACELDRVISA